MNTRTNLSQATFQSTSLSDLLNRYWECPNSQKPSCTKISKNALVKHRISRAKMQSSLVWTWLANSVSSSSIWFHRHNLCWLRPSYRRWGITEETRTPNIYVLPIAPHWIPLRSLRMKQWRLDRDQGCQVSLHHSKALRATIKHPNNKPYQRADYGMMRAKTI